MKILHVSTPMSWRGGEQQAAFLMMALKSAGIEVAVVCPAGSVLAGKMENARIPVFTYSKRGLLDLLLAKKIASMCSENNFDIIHTHDSHAHSAAVLSATIFGNAKPIVVSRRVDFPVSNHLFSSWKYNHASVKKIISVSEMIQKITAPAIKDKSKLCVIHSGIAVNAYDFIPEENLLRKELSIKPEEKIIGNFSALADHKDYPTFLEVARLLLEAGHPFHFVIAGDGAEEHRIKSFISKHQLQSRIHLLGFRKDIPALMKSLDLFLITSRTEGLGTIVLEAFAAGVPVVATAAGGIPELVEDQKTGLLAGIGHLDALKNAVLRIFADPEQRNTLVNNARQKVNTFSFQATAEKTRKVYEEVLRS
jgi:glycosyltransferase involved in cell wall biosynthesis